MLYFSGRSNPALVRELANALATVIPCIATTFDDGEPNVRIPNDVAGADVIIIQSTHTAEYFVELLAMVDAAKRSGAARVTAVIPYFGYGRQDRQAAPGTPITAAVVCRALAAAGADHLITVDLHAPHIAEYFSGTLTNISALPFLLDALLVDTGLDPATIALVSPDAGDIERCHIAAASIGCPHVTFVEKHRDPLTQKISTAGINDPAVIRGRDCILIDDMIATGTTLVFAAEELVRAGSRRISAICTHPVLVTERAAGQRALAAIVASRIERLDLGDTIPLEGDRAPTPAEAPRIRAHSIAPLLAQAISPSQ